MYNVNIPNNPECCVYRVKQQTHSIDYYDLIMNELSPNTNWYSLNNTDVFSDFDSSSLSAFSFPSSGSFLAISVPEAGLLGVFKGVIGGNSFIYKRNCKAIVVREENLDSNDSLLSEFQSNPAIEKEAAYNCAIDILAKLDLDPSFDLLRCENAIAITSSGCISHGWDFIFTRRNKDLLTPYIDYCDLWANSAPPTSFAPWEKEVVFIYIDENGLFRIDARGLGMIESIVDESPRILSFEEILPKINDQLIAQHSLNVAQSINVDEISLCCCLISGDELFGYGICIPCWKVKYYLCEGSCFNYSNCVELTVFFNSLNGEYIEPRSTIDIIK